MDFALTPDQVRIRDLCRALAEDFAGRAEEHDRDATSPLKDYEALRDAGLYGLVVPEEFGGWGAGFVGYCIAAEELAQGSPATAMSFNMHCALLGIAFKSALPDAVKQVFADLVVKEGKLMCASLSESGHAGLLYGSRTCSTQLRRADGGYVLNGRKTFCTMVDAADFICLFVAPEDATTPEAAVLVMLPTALPGLRIERVWDTLGLRATRSDNVVLDDCFVPAEAVLDFAVDSLPEFLCATDAIVNVPYTAV
jgi:alkylation response protein AidB-like acyl-CoA dehydrogenase